MSVSEPQRTALVAAGVSFRVHASLGAFWSASQAEHTSDDMDAVYVAYDDDTCVMVMAPSSAALDRSHHPLYLLRIRVAHPLEARRERRCGTRPGRWLRCTRWGPCSMLCSVRRTSTSQSTCRSTEGCSRMRSIKPDKTWQLAASGHRLSRCALVHAVRAARRASTACV